MIRRMQIRLLTSLLFFGLLGISTPSTAAEPDWYQIEILLFAQQPDYQRSSELWRDDFAPDNSSNPVKLEEKPGGNLSRQPFLLLPSDQRQLNNSAQRIERAPDLRLLKHLAWRQPVQQKDQAQAVLIQAGDRFDGEYELEGTLTIFRGRYLHASSDLFFSQFKNIENINQLDWSVFSKDGGVSDSDAWLQDQNLEKHNEPVSASRPGIGSNARFIRAATARLNQSRRMRSNELHYIDHPLFGILVQITPYKQPDPAMDLQAFSPDKLPEKRPAPGLNSAS